MNHIQVHRLWSAGPEHTSRLRDNKNHSETFQLIHQFLIQFVGVLEGQLPQGHFRTRGGNIESFDGVLDRCKDLLELAERVSQSSSAARVLAAEIYGTSKFLLRAKIGLQELAVG